MRKPSLPESFYFRLGTSGPLILLLLLGGCNRQSESDGTAASYLAQCAARAFEGRLFNQVLYRPFGPVRLDEQRRLVTTIHHDEPGTMRRGPAPIRAEGLAGAASLALVIGQPDKAIQYLERALRLEPDSARLHNDLAVAFLERGRDSSHPLDLLMALRASRRAIVLAPDSPAPAFNLGLALDRLCLRNTARQAFRRYLSLDRASEWTYEARSRLVLLAEESNFQEEWASWKARLLRREQPTATELQRLVQQYPHQLREIVVEDLLPAMVANGPGTAGKAAAATSSLVHAIAGEMTLQRGDELIAGTLKALSRSREPKERQVRAFRQFADGMRNYHSHDFSTAAERLSKAMPVLRADVNPMGMEAELYAAICQYYTSSETALRRFRALLSQIDAERFPSLAGRTLWMIGTAAGVHGRYEEAVSALRQMRPLLLRGAGVDQAAMADVLLAETYDLRGEVERGWTHRLSGLTISIERGTPRRRASVLHEAAQALARRGQEDLASLFLDELLFEAPKWGMPVAWAEAYSLRARIGSKREDPGALKDAGRALEKAAAMSPGGLQRRILGAALISKGLARLSSDPAAATEDLEDGLTLELETGWDDDRVLVLNALANARMALGDPAGARAHLVESVEHYERVFDEARETRTRIAVFGHAQKTFESLMQLALQEPRGGFEEAFLWSERARARYLHDAWAASRGSKPSSSDEALHLIRRLPRDVTVVEFATLPDRTLAWVAEDGILRGEILSTSRDQLIRIVDLFRQALERGDAEDSRSLGANLYDLLLKPLEPFGNTTGRLAVIPDGPLALIPFAALFDRISGRYLVQRTTVTVVPSATMLSLLQSQANTRFPEPPFSVLVVGAPDLSQSAFSYLPDLPGAAEEASAIARLYPQHLALLGAEASRIRFLQALPEFSVLHFAGHAVALDHTRESSLLLLSPTAEGDTGEVSTQEIRNLSLARTGLVVLAACRSMDGYRAGREGVLSIASSFLAARVPSVVAALWDVDDRLSPELMQRFHEFVVAGSAAPEALRAAMLESLAGDRQQRNPATWAVFAALGV